MDNSSQALDKYWTDALVLLHENMTEATYDSLIKKMRPLYMNGSDIFFKIPNSVSKEIINKRYLSDITDAIELITGAHYNVQLMTNEELKNNPSSINIEKNNINSNLKSKYIFETFVRGKSNELAYAAAVAVSESPGRTTYNPLFLYGGVGLGKTHLMHSIGNYILEHDTSSKVLYCSTETFVNEMITSIKDKKNQEFRNKYRDIDVLLIDDIQFLSDKEGTQEEFFHTFNTLYDTNKQIVISSDQPPREIKTLEDRLRSRFAWGLIVDVKLPDFETRTAILEKKSEIDNLTIPKEVTKFIAKSIVSNIRDLEGALNKIMAYAKLSNREINLDMANKALRDLISGSKKHEITFEYVQEVVSSYYEITITDMCSKKRTASIAFPRQVAMYLCRKTMDISLPKVGDIFGGRDHSTVLYACDKISDEAKRDSNLRNVLIDLENRIRDGI